MREGTSFFWSHLSFICLIYSLYLGNGRWHYSPLCSQSMVSSPCALITALPCANFTHLQTAQWRSTHLSKMSPFSWHFRGNLTPTAHLQLAFEGPMVWVYLTYSNSPPFPQMSSFTQWPALLTTAQAHPPGQCHPHAPSCTPSPARGLPHVTLLTLVLPSHDTLKTAEAQPSKWTESSSPMFSSLALPLHCPHPTTTGLQPSTRGTVLLNRDSLNGMDTHVTCYLALRS